MGILIVVSYLIVGLSQVSLPAQILPEQELVRYSSSLSANPLVRNQGFVPEGRRQKAEGGRKRSLYSKVFSLFQLDTYFRPPALALRLAAAPPPETLEVFAPNIEQLIENQCRDAPTGVGIPAFQPGIGKADVLRMLGVPNGSSRGYWPNTRAVFYDLIPDQVSLGFLFDRQSERIRQTEASFTAEVDTQVVSLTLNGMLGCKLNEQIKLGLQKVRRGESPQYSFKLDSLEGIIELQKGDRLYIGIWEADLH